MRCERDRLPTRKIMEVEDDGMRRILGPRASGLGPRASGLGPRASGLGPRASASGLVGASTTRQPGCRRSSVARGGVAIPSSASSSSARSRTHSSRHGAARHRSPAPAAVPALRAHQRGAGCQRARRTLAAVATGNGGTSPSRARASRPIGPARSLAGAPVPGHRRTPRPGRGKGPRDGSRSARSPRDRARTFCRFSSWLQLGCSPRVA
jgi:hypothetical protein